MIHKTAALLGASLLALAAWGALAGALNFALRRSTLGAWAVAAAV